MKSIRFFGLSVVGMLCFALITFSGACSTAPAEGEKPAADAGSGKPTPKPEIKITLDPKDGKLGVDGACIKVTFSRDPSKKDWEGELKGDDGVVAGGLTFKTNTTGEYCPFSFLKQGKKYSFKLKVKEPAVKGLTQRTFEVSSNYDTDAPYKDDPAPAAGFTVNLKLGDIIAPKGLTAIASNLSTDNIPPILTYLFKKEGDKAGALTFVGGLGKAAKGEKPHTGKDIVDTKTPVSLLLEGKYEGRLFSVGPTTFLLSVAGISLELQDFNLTGLFTKDSKKVESALLTGVIDPEVVEKSVGLQICALLRDECKKDASGKTYVRLAAKISSVPNPLPYSVFITHPLYLQTDIDPSKPVAFYTNEETDEASLTAKVFTCKGSRDEQKPCDKGKEAKVEEVKEKGTFKLEDSKKQGSYTVKLEAATWYKIEFTAKSKGGTEFKTFSMFKTK